MMNAYAQFTAALAALSSASFGAQAATAGFKTVHVFTFEEGVIATTPLEASNGFVYGTAKGGGQFNDGTLYRMSPQGMVEVLHDFSASADDGRMPYGRLIEASDGNLYGTTHGGGAFNDGGTVYRIGLDGTFAVLHSFGAAGDTDSPIAGVTQGKDGNLYGVTCSTAVDGFSAVFSMTLQGDYRILYRFRNDSTCPQGDLLEASDGLLYGTTLAGGQFNAGTVYSVSKAGRHTIVHSFSPEVDGSEVHSALVQTADGLFYGTAEFGGANGGGTVFRMDAAGNMTTLHAFPERSDDGSRPEAGLVVGDDGNLYGTTEFGGGTTRDCGLDGCGIVFRMAPDGTMSTVHVFGSNFMGADPQAQLARASDHRIMGTANKRDARVQGTIFTFREQRP
jgi:uncharacterized repeat protein (TIGR03803 family)